MNFSRQREIIYEQVRNFPVHPTAEEVYRAKKRQSESELGNSIPQSESAQRSGNAS